MTVLNNPSGPAFEMTAHQRLYSFSAASLRHLSTTLRDIFGGQMALSTVSTGERRNEVTDEQQADFKDIAAALSHTTFSGDPVMRDQFACEPSMLAFIRQFEGHPPQPLAVISAETAAQISEAVSEIRAMGYSTLPGDRFLTLRAPAGIEIKEDGNVTFGAGIMWRAFNAAISSAGLLDLTPLSALFDSPQSALQSGVFGPGATSRQSGYAWSSRTKLPPASSRVHVRHWLFSSPEAAENACRVLSRQLQPDFIETLSHPELRILSAAGKIPLVDSDVSQGMTGLRVVFITTDRIGKASMKDANDICQRHNGRIAKSFELIPRHDLETLLAASGAARFIRKPNAPYPLPANAITSRYLFSMRGELSECESVIYLRDLRESVKEAQRLMGLPPDAPSPLSSNTGVWNDDGLLAHG